MKRIKKSKRLLHMLYCLVLSGSSILISTPIMATSTSIGYYDYVDDNHSVSNMSFKKNGEYTYSLFCIESQKVIPSSDKTEKCKFCENSIVDAQKFAKEMSEVKLNEYTKTVEKLDNRVNKMKNGWLIAGFIITLLIAGCVGAWINENYS